MRLFCDVIDLLLIMMEVFYICLTKINFKLHDVGQGYTGPKTGNQDQGIEPWTHKKIMLQGKGIEPWTYKKDHMQSQGLEPWTD